MTEYNGLEDIKEPLKNMVVTIGNFDGVHKGHQELIRLAVEKSEETGFEPLAVTFEPHPIKCISPQNNPPVITPLVQKKELIKRFGIDNILTIKFSKEFAKVSAQEFIEDILVKKLGASFVIVGTDFLFGKKRLGDVNLLKEYGKKYGFTVILPDLVKIQDNRISSTLIRKYVEDGKLDQAKDMLGRNYQIRGKVIHGRNRGGSKIGFPTANLELVDELCPKLGVYAVLPKINDKIYMGVANIGFSPTFDDNKFTVEVHVMDFSGDLYDKQIKVDFVKRLRGEVKFSGIEELSRQIAKDIESAKTILKDYI